MDDCVGERLNDCMADYVPFDKREVDTWQGQVEKQLAYSKAIEGQQAVPHPNEAEIEEVFQGIELFKEIPPEKGSHFNINDVAKQAEHYQVTAKVSRGALSSVIDPGRKKRLKALKRRARALGLEGRAMTGITCSTEPNRKQRWQGQHNHDGYNFSLRSEEEGPVTEFRDLVILMLRKEKTHALHLGVKEYPAHKYYEHKLSTPEEWAAGTGPGYKTFKAWKDSR